jgi:hypothetical protein
MARRSTSNLEWLVALALLIAPAARADEDQQEAFRDIGAVLGWRLSPEALEERCRAADPDGASVRKQALDTWLAKNVALIRQVDSRIADVVPLLIKEKPAADAVRAVREQVKQMVLESVTEAVCVAERDPASTSWTSNGVPHVPESLAALYDWQVRHTPR